MSSEEDRLPGGAAAVKVAKERTQEVVEVAEGSRNSCSHLTLMRNTLTKTASL